MLPGTRAIAKPAGRRPCVCSLRAGGLHRGDVRCSTLRRSTPIVTGSVLLVALGCKPSGQREPEAAALPPSPQVRPGLDDDDRNDRVEDEGVSAPAPRPEVADSAMPKQRRIVDPRTRSGLAAFANEVLEDGLAWVGPLEGNGGRDVLVYVPPGADDRAEFRLVYHFHGTYSESVEKERPGRPKKEWVGWNRLEQTLAATTDLQASTPDNVALVVPLSAGKRREPDATGWWNGAYDRMWMAPTEHPEHRDSFETLHAEVRSILREQFGVHASKLERPVIAEGHSAGGIALRNIAVAGTQAVGEYLFQDASFQTWSDGCYEAVRSGRSSGRVTLVITTGGIADPLAGRDPWCARLETRASAWNQHRQGCASKPERTPSGAKATCAELQAAADEWPAFASWCENMKNDMADVPEVYVHRTRIPHGKQPRHFTGGLELPAAWHESSPTAK